MSESEQIIFFDLPSRPPNSSWSLNPWKTRFLLNYKGLPYTTRWVEYPDIKPLVEPHLPPNKEGTDYTIPTIKFPDGTYVMDSRIIVDKIESLHPSPSVHLSDPHLAKLEALMPQLMNALVGIYTPLCFRRLVNEASQPHLIETRLTPIGMTLESFEKAMGGEQAWEGAKPLLNEITELLKDTSGGPYFMGQSVSYTDFVWGGFLVFFKRIGDDLFEKLMENVPDKMVHLELLKGLEEWSVRSDR